MTATEDTFTLEDRDDGIRPLICECGHAYERHSGNGSCDGFVEDVTGCSDGCTCVVFRQGSAISDLCSNKAKMREWIVDKIKIGLPDNSGVSVGVAPFIPSSEPFVNAHLSISRLQAFEQCARMFYYRYHSPKGALLKVEDYDMGAGTFGSFLHAAHEALVKWVVDTEFTGIIPPEIIREHTQAAWASTDGTKGLDAYTEGAGYIRKYFSRSFNCWDILDVEKEFRIQVGEFTVLGYMDRVDKIEVDGKPGVRIVDYKSNRAMYTKADLDVNMQLAVYTIAAKELYPWAEVIEAEMHMLRYGGKAQQAHITPEVLAHTRDYLVAMGRKTESDKEWKATLNPNCGYCEYKEHCDVYDQATRIGLPMTKSKPDDLLSVSDEREQVHKIASAAYARKKKLDDVLKAAINKLPPEHTDLVLGSQKYYFSHPSGGTRYPLLELFKLLKEHGVPRDKQLALAEVDPKKVEAFLETFFTERSNGGAWANGVLEAEIEALAVKLDGSARLEARKVK